MGSELFIVCCGAHTVNYRWDRVAAHFLIAILFFSVTVYVFLACFAPEACKREGREGFAKNARKSQTAPLAALFN